MNTITATAINVSYLPRRHQLAAIIVIETPAATRTESAAYLGAYIQLVNWTYSNGRRIAARLRMVDRVTDDRDSRANA